MAHTLGAVYDTPHGVACAMMLPIVMEYNQECTGEKYREIARAMGVQGADEMSQEEYRKAAIDAVKKLSADVGIPTKLDAIKEEYERAPIWLGSELFLCFVYCKNRGKMLKKVLSNNQSNNKLKNFYFLIIRVPVAPLTPSFAFCKRVMRAVRPSPDSANSTPA